MIAKLFVEGLVSINLFFGSSIDSFLMLCWCLVLVSVCLFVYLSLSETNLAATLMWLDSPAIVDFASKSL